MKIETIIRQIQKEVNVTPDGLAGPLTWAAIHKNVVGTPIAEEDEGQVDERSEGIISTLLPEVRPFARALVQKAEAKKIVIKIISGRRTFDEQDALYAQGRTNPGPVVTNAKAGFSNHNFGIAFDVGIFDGRRYLGSSPLYKVVGALGADLGLEWGGNWTTIVDEPHFQLRPDWAKNLSSSEFLADLRTRVSSGVGLFS